MPFFPLLAADGFNPLDPSGAGGAVWTWLIFLISLPLIWKMVMGPITRALYERDERANSLVSRAEQASADAESARAEVEVKLGEARAEAQRILQGARERGEVREREIVDKAKEEANALLSAASAQIRAEKDKALAAIRDEVVQLSIGAASKVLERNVGSEDDRRLVESFVASGSRSGSGA
ncbi:ATP synthase subunit b [Planctomycetes bacterium Pla163]|jgi:F-type H+-transporting ATPase subunit b|uniref:ATP synthase subunit b n=1 Tax=Rohdeia mirabilis TaxID=2528008 RepID=A0A518D085_9BACT|nr:ATP synthase subunit b [Planctomycetes bacterium Pla163]